jgi:hypothetical protein
MRRFITIFSVAILAVTVFLFIPSSGRGCHGGCSSTPEIGEGDCYLGHDVNLREQLSTAELNSETNPLLCEIEITLGPEEGSVTSDSYVWQGEATVFYVQEGKIKFEVNGLDEEELGEPWDNDIGIVQVVPQTGDELEEASNLVEIVPDQVFQAGPDTSSFTMSAGGSIYLFEQVTDVALSYTYVDDGEGEEVSSMLISSAPPPGMGEGTPEATPSS